MPHTPKTGPAPDLTSANKIQVLVELYKEHCSHGRHTETQRHLVTAMFLTAAGALLTIVSYNKFELWTWPLGVSVCVLGLLGLGFARVYEIKWDETGVRRSYYREQIQDLAGISPMPPNYVPRQKPADKVPRRKLFTRLRSYWRLTFIFMVAAGVIATWLSLKH